MRSLLAAARAAGRPSGSAARSKPAVRRPRHRRVLQREEHGRLVCRQGHEAKAWAWGWQSFRAERSAPLLYAGACAVSQPLLPLSRHTTLRPPAGWRKVRCAEPSTFILKRSQYLSAADRHRRRPRGARRPVPAPGQAPGASRVLLLHRRPRRVPRLRRLLRRRSWRPLRSPVPRRRTAPTAAGAPAGVRAGGHGPRALRPAGFVRKRWRHLRPRRREHLQHDFSRGRSRRPTRLPGHRRPPARVPPQVRGRLLSLRYHRQPFTADGVVVHSCLRPQQGCTWGTLVCALVHQRALTLATLHHPGSTVDGFADDAHVHNPVPERAFSSLLLLRQVLKERVGVQHNDKGGCIAAPGLDISFAPASFPGSPHHSDGPRRAYSALGGFVGPPDLVSDALYARVLALDRDIDSCRFLVDSPRCRYALQARLRLIRDCACHAVTHLVRAHAPSVSLAAADLHDKLVRHAVFHGLAPPPDSPPSAVERAATLLHLPTRLGGHGFTSAVATAPAAFLASALEAFASTLRTLLPHFGHTDLATEGRPSFVAIRAAHARVLQALSSVESGYASLDSSTRYVDAFGDPHPPFHPIGLPSFATQPPDPGDNDKPPDGGTDPRAGIRPARMRPLRCILPLAAYLDLPATRYKCAQRTFSAVLHHAHAAWLRLLLSGSQRDCALLVSASQRGAHDFHHAPLSDPRSHVPSALFRLASSTTWVCPSPASTPLTCSATPPSALRTTPLATPPCSPRGTRPRSPLTPRPAPSASLPTTRRTPPGSGPTSTSPASTSPLT